MMDFDIRILNWINHHRVPGSTPFLVFVSDVTTYVSIIVMVSLLIAGLVKRSRSLLAKFYCLLCVFLLDVSISQTLKNTFYRPRPFRTYPFIEKLTDGGSSSFPSGHTFEVFAMATALTLLFPQKKVIIPAYIWACIVAYTRMALGVHYPTDVLAGMILGIGIAFLCYAIYKKFRRPLQQQ